MVVLEKEKPLKQETHQNKIFTTPPLRRTAWWDWELGYMHFSLARSNCMHAMTKRNKIHWLITPTPDHEENYMSKFFCCAHRIKIILAHFLYKTMLFLEKILTSPRFESLPCLLKIYNKSKIDNKDTCLWFPCKWKNYLYLTFFSKK